MFVMHEHHAPQSLSTVMLPQYAAWAASTCLGKAALLRVLVMMACEVGWQPVYSAAWHCIDLFLTPSLITWRQILMST